MINERWRVQSSRDIIRSEPSPLKFVPNMQFPASISRVLSVAALVALAGAVVVPGASTPSFYLVASTNATTGANLLVSHILKYFMYQ